MQKPAETLQLVCSEGRRFQVVGLLGRGGFGEVYLAEMESPGGLPLTVALKLLLPGLDPGSQAVERLRDEARVLALLHHSAILKVHDLVVIGKRVGLVMEYVPGTDLNRLIRGDGRMPPRCLVQVLEQVADALDAAYSAHARGEPLHIVHRDVKPGNIRVTPRGEVKLLDFGIAKAQLDSAEAYTVSGHIVGSVPYMAPERFRPGATGGGTAGDVYALGCILVEGLVGRPLMKGLSWQKVAGMSFQSEAFEAHLELFLEEAPEVPEDLVQLAHHMLDPRPERRPTARQVVERLEGIRRALPDRGLRAWARERGAVEPAGKLSSEDVLTLSGSVSERVRTLPATAWERRPLFRPEAQEDSGPVEEPSTPEPRTAPSASTLRVRRRARTVAWVFGGLASSFIVGTAAVLLIAAATLWAPAVADGAAQSPPLDVDGDGVPDVDDGCPHRAPPGGFDADLDGCVDDWDGDGVADVLDRCRTTPPLAARDVDSDGCTDDRDGDGAPDVLDECVTHPRSRALDGDGDGCADDEDGDGVPDQFDRCPLDAAPPEVDLDRDGCVDRHRTWRDSDGDGEPDARDACPDLVGVASASGCPDEDGDGIRDGTDACRGEAGIASDRPEYHGCADSDGDGVPDRWDQCKLRPERQDFANGDGC